MVVVVTMTRHQVANRSCHLPIRCLKMMKREVVWWGAQLFHPDDGNSQMAVSHLLVLLGDWREVDKGRVRVSGSHSMVGGAKWHPFHLT